MQTGPAGRDPERTFMEAFRDLKKSARLNLRGLWPRAAAILLLLRVPGLLMGLTEQGLRLLGGQPAFLEGIFAAANPAPASMAAAAGCGLLCFLLWIPLFMGSLRWYWRANQGQQEKTGALFYYFESYAGYLKAAGLGALIGLRMLLWYALFCLPLAVTAGLAFWYRFRFGFLPELGAAKPLFTLVLVLWPLLAAVLVCITGQRYFLAPRLLAEKPREPVRRVLRKSVRLMRGYRAQVFLLRLSFWPWYLPGAAGACCFGAALTPNPAREILFWAALALTAAQLALGFYLKPWRGAALARYAGEILYGAVEREDPESVTREYVYKSEELTLPPLGDPFGQPGPFPEELGNC